MGVSPTVMLMLLAMVIATVYGAHFQGGTWNWKPSSDGKANVTYMMTFSGFRNTGDSEPTRGHDVCNPTVKASGKTLRTPGKSTCEGCEPSTWGKSVTYQSKIIEEKDMSWICTDWDEDGNWDIGGRTFEVQPENENTKVLLYYNHYAWIGPIENVNPQISLGWRMVTEIDLSPRRDNEEINSSPITSPRPVRKYHENCDYKLEIQVSDPDNDKYQCRKTYADRDECYERGPRDSSSINGDMCGDLDKITVFPNCTLLFDSHGPPGRYAVRVMIEDFDANDVPLSKISLSFLLNVVPGPSNCDRDHPVIREPKCTSRNITRGEQFTMTVVAEAADASLLIERIETSKPSGMEISRPLGVVSGKPLQKSVTLTWTPTATGSYQVTFSAVDKLGFASDWSSITLNVVERVEQLVILPGESYPQKDQHLTSLTGFQWFVKFNRAVVQPSKSAYITLRNASNNVVKQLDSSKRQVEFRTNTIRFEEMLDTSTFEGDQTFTLNVDEGVALDRIHGNCADGSVASNWGFTITGTKSPTIVTPTSVGEPANPTGNPPGEKPNPQPPNHDCTPVKISTPGKADGKKCFIHPKVNELTVKDENVEVTLCCEGACSHWMD